MNWKSYLFLLPVIFLLSSLSVEAQNANLNYVQFNEQSGLPQNFVYNILRDQKGLIWIGTGKGLSRYDGKNIRNFTTKDGLAKDFITSSLLTSSGRIVFGHFQGSISLYNGVFFEKMIGDTLNSDIVSIVEDSQKRIWCASRSNGFLRWNKELTKHEYIFPSELHEKIINQIKIFKKLLLVATSEGLYIFRLTPDGLVFESILATLLFQDVTALERVKGSNEYWVGTADKGIYMLQLKQEIKLITLSSFLFLKDVNIRFIAQHNIHSVWIGTFDKGVIYLKFGESYALEERAYFNESTGFPMSSISTILASTRTGEAAWVGTLHNGLVYLNKPLFNHYDYSAVSPTIKTINSIAQGEDNSFYLATDIGLFHLKLNILDSTEEKSFTPINVLVKEPILSLLYFNRFLWVGTKNKGIYLFSKQRGQLKRIPLQSSILKTVKARFFKSDIENNLWVSAMGEGVIKMDQSGKILEHHSTSTGFVHNEIFAIHPDSGGDVWFGSLGAGLAKIESSGKLLRFSQQGIFPSHNVQSITEDSEKNIWIATDGQGYFKFDGETFEQMGGDQKNEPLHIKGIGYDQRHNKIWVNTQKNLTYFDIQKKKRRRFEQEQNLLKDKNYSSSIFFGTQNNALLITNKGLLYFNLDDVPPPVSLETHIVDIQISFKPYIPSQPSQKEILQGIYPPILLTYEENHVTFNYIARDPSYTGPVYYRYYIEGLEPTWSPPTTQEIISYPFLKPGSHELHVQASHNPDKWNNAEMIYSFILKIPYWDTGWFYLLQITGIISLFGFTYLKARNPASKQSISRIMTFACIFILFEYAQVWFEPIMVDTIDSVPIYRTLFNLLLALVLLPLERVFKMFFRGKHTPKKKFT